MPSNQMESSESPTRTEITRLERETGCMDDVSLFNIDDGQNGNAVEEVSGKTFQSSHMQEILRTQLRKAEESLAANHERALLLLARCLATVPSRSQADTDNDTECRDLRTAPATLAQGGEASTSRADALPGVPHGSASEELGSQPGSPHSPISCIRSKADETIASQNVANAWPPCTRLGEPRPPPGVAPSLENVSATSHTIPNSRSRSISSPSAVKAGTNEYTLFDAPPLLTPMGGLIVSAPLTDSRRKQSLLSVDRCSVSGPKSSDHADDHKHNHGPGNDPIRSDMSLAPNSFVKDKNHLGPCMTTTRSDMSQLDRMSYSMTKTVSARKMDGADSQNFFFEVLSTWKKDEKKAAANKQLRMKHVKQKGRVRTTAAQQLERLISESAWSGDHMDGFQGQRPSRCIMHPHSTTRNTWDLCSLCLVTYDMAVIPLSFFEPPESSFLTVCAWITRFFWTFDIAASFLTGFLKADGSTEMHFVKIARRYILSWLLLDLMIVGVDWFEVLMSSMGSMGAARLVRSSRTIRIIRLVRLLRLVRMQTVLQHFIENIQSEVGLVVLDIIKMIVLILGMAHFVACIWYGIGAIEGNDDTWVHNFGYARLSLGYRYATSLHWSLSQFAGGMDEVTPVNIKERLYVILVFLLCFIVAAVFVSHITSSMTRLHMITSQQSYQLSVLRKYFQQNKISKRLAARVLRNAKNAVAEKQRFMPESAVELIFLVSEPLRVELHFEVYTPILEVHNFFKAYIDECPQVMRKVCHAATAMSAVSPGDLVFNSGEMPSAPKMYFVVSGGLAYTAASGTVHDVAPGEWLSEGTLWTPWTHRGDLEATTECRLCTIDAKRFQELVCQFEHVGFDPKDHAAYFVECLNKLDAELTDLDFLDASPRRRKYGRESTPLMAHALSIVPNRVSAFAFGYRSSGD